MVEKGGPQKTRDNPHPIPVHPPNPGQKRRKAEKEDQEVEGAAAETEGGGAKPIAGVCTRLGKLGVALWGKGPAPTEPTGKR